MKTNGIVHHDSAQKQHATEGLVGSGSSGLTGSHGRRNIMEVIAAMLIQTPEGDDLVPMLGSIIQAHQMLGCKETEHMAWGSITQAMIERFRLFGKNAEIPDWYQKAAAIFRGDA